MKSRELFYGVPNFRRHPAAVNTGRQIVLIGLALALFDDAAERDRQVIGRFGAETVRVRRARLVREDGSPAEWRSKALRRHQRLTRRAEALIAGAYLAETNTRRVRRALAALFDGAVGKDVVSRAWRKVKADWEAWGRRDLAGEDIVRLILDGTVVRVRLDRKAPSVSLLVSRARNS